MRPWHWKAVRAVLEHSAQESFVPASQEAVVESSDEDYNLFEKLCANWVIVN
jgi:hypothetical protein